MMRYYTPKHFTPEELLPPAIVDVLGGSVLTELFDSRILWTLDALRERFCAPITVNNWKWGGKLTQRGFRTDPKIGALISQHRFGRAADFDIKGVTAAKFRRMARTRELDRELQYITRIENATKWCHVDCMNITGTDLIFFTG